MVRVTTRLRWLGSSSRALGAPARRNSAYASSTTTIPSGSREQSSSTSSGGKVVLLDHLPGVRRVEGEVLGTVTLDPGGVRATGVLRIHRVRRREAHRGATGT